jgi:hypothetical protein
MQPTQKAITGKEEQGDLSMPYQSLVQFYYAFNSGDMKMMSENWLQSDDIAMDNPLGGISVDGKRYAQYMSVFLTARRKSTSSISITRFTRRQRCSMPSGGNAGISV